MDKQRGCAALGLGVEGVPSDARARHADRGATTWLCQVRPHTLTSTPPASACATGCAAAKAMHAKRRAWRFMITRWGAFRSSLRRAVNGGVVDAQLWMRATQARALRRGEPRRNIRLKILTVAGPISRTSETRTGRGGTHAHTVALTCNDAACGGVAAETSSEES